MFWKYLIVPVIGTIILIILSELQNPKKQVKKKFGKKFTLDFPYTLKDFYKIVSQLVADKHLKLEYLEENQVVLTGIISIFSANYFFILIFKEDKLEVGVRGKNILAPLSVAGKIPNRFISKLKLLIELL
ncbi:MAG TPA: hypothetical protein DHM37_05895 [Candidatus Cloacimonas sp.]|nr:hypothetical protein [Candidatus Cloacimonas sp.]